MDLSRFPRRAYTTGPTPIQRLDRFSRALGPGGPTVYIKRDDLLGLAGGGNKTRKLEFLVADALAKGADTLITCGGVQSNHCRLTLSAAAVEGLRCRLVLAEMAPGEYRPDGAGNVQLYHLLGAERIITIPWGADQGEALEQAAEEARSEGRRPYPIPLGGSVPLGALGYAVCARELLGQARESGLEFHHVLLSVGSTGTLAGLLLGLGEEPRPIPVTAVSVLRPRETAEAAARDLLRATAALLGDAPEIPAERVVCLDDYVGPGYAQPTPGMLKAVALLARTEGILLDPTYTGKAMAGLIDLVRRGQFREGENVLFLHTGGAPGLFAHPELFPGA
jgi:D-cysteine desulfhydrase